MTELRQRIETLETEREAIANRLAEAREQAARNESEIAGMKATAHAEIVARETLISELRQAREREAEILRAALGDLALRLDTATEELAAARRPWWVRLFR